MRYYVKVVLPVLLVTLISVVPSSLFANSLNASLLTSALVIVFSVAASTIAMYYIGLDKYWRKKVVNVLRNKLFKNRKVA